MVCPKRQPEVSGDGRGGHERAVDDNTRKGLATQLRSVLGEHVCPPSHLANRVQGAEPLADRIRSVVPHLKERWILHSLAGSWIGAMPHLQYECFVPLEAPIDA